MSGPYREPGAATHLLATRCLFCASRLVRDVCASCGEDAPSEGAPRAAELRAECPRCFVALELSRFAEWDAGFVYCVGCHGCFVPPVDWAIMLDRVGGFGRVPGDELAPLPEGQGPRAAALKDAVSCPVCRGGMKRVDFADQENLPVDVCSAHGIWFDAAELAAALRATDDDEHVLLGRPVAERAVAEAPEGLAPSLRVAPPPRGSPRSAPEDEKRGVLDAVLTRLRELF